MDKQIEELKRLLDTMVGNSSQLKAEKLYAAGYRKVKHGEWIFEAHYFYDDYGDLIIYATAKCSECEKEYSYPNSTVAYKRVERPENLSGYDDWEVDVEPFLLDILEEARARKDLQNYCPNCGAKMNGGEK